jgi:hypothetical protein
MNIHLPAILMWTTGVQGFDTLPNQWNLSIRVRYPSGIGDRRCWYLSGPKKNWACHLFGTWNQLSHMDLGQNPGSPGT